MPADPAQGAETPEAADPIGPATGAPAFYKRLKAGFGDEPNPCNWKWYDYINPLSYGKMGLTALKDGAVDVGGGFQVPHR